MIKCISHEKDRNDNSCTVDVGKTVKLCYGEGEDREYWSVLDIDGVYYEIGEMQTALQKYFPNDYQEIWKQLQEIAKEKGLECVE